MRIAYSERSQRSSRSGGYRWTLGTSGETPEWPTTQAPPSIRPCPMWPRIYDQVLFRQCRCRCQSSPRPVRQQCRPMSLQPPNNPRHGAQLPVFDYRSQPSSETQSIVNYCRLAFHLRCFTVDPPYNSGTRLGLCTSDYMSMSCVRTRRYMLRLSLCSMSKTLGVS